MMLSCTTRNFQRKTLSGKGSKVNANFFVATHHADSRIKATVRYTNFFLANHLPVPCEVNLARRQICERLPVNPITKTTPYLHFSPALDKVPLFVVARVRTNKNSIERSQVLKVVICTIKDKSQEMFRCEKNLHHQCRHLLQGRCHFFAHNSEETILHTPWHHLCDTYKNEGLRRCNAFFVKPTFFLDFLLLTALLT